MNCKIKLAIVITSSALAGAIVGYQYAKRKSLDTMFQLIDTIDELEASVEDLPELDRQEDEEDLDEDYADFVNSDMINLFTEYGQDSNDYDGDKVEEEELEDETPEPDIKEGFSRRLQEMSEYDDLLKDSVDNKPYFINDESWDEGQDDYERLTLTFYEEDGVLADDRNYVVDDYEKLIGLKTLTGNYFGDFAEYSTGDPNIVFVRNPILNTDFEIIRDERSYLQGVQSSTNLMNNRDVSKTPNKR